MATHGNLRRVALYCRRSALAVGDDAIADVWSWKQAQEPGTPLPADFPELATLATLLYTTYEDLDGADEYELTSQGFSSTDAATIVAAAAAGAVS